MSWLNDNAGKEDSSSDVWAGQDSDGIGLAPVDGPAAIQELYPEAERRKLANLFAMSGYGFTDAYPPLASTPYVAWIPPGLARPEVAMQIECVMDSCFNKALLGGTVGAVMGVGIGLILGAMPGNQMDNPHQSTQAERLVTRPGEAYGSGFKRKLRFYGNDTINRARDMSKTFGRFSIVYSGTECAISKYRGKHDIVNHLAGGYLTGMVLAARSGPGASVAAGIACGAFSGAIDMYMEGREWSELTNMEW